MRGNRRPVPDRRQHARRGRGVIAHQEEGAATSGAAELATARTRGATGVQQALLQKIHQAELRKQTMRGVGNRSEIGGRQSRLKQQAARLPTALTQPAQRLPCRCIAGSHAFADGGDMRPGIAATRHGSHDEMQLGSRQGLVARQDASGLFPTQKPDPRMGRETGVGP